VVINRFGRMEREGERLSFLIDAAIDGDIPAIITVPEARFDDWVRFSGGLSIKLGCELQAMRRWWSGLARAGRCATQQTAAVGRRA
jgi:hypothetical protein